MRSKGKCTLSISLIKKTLSVTHTMNVLYIFFMLASAKLCLIHLTKRPWHSYFTVELEEAYL